MIEILLFARILLFKMASKGQRYTLQAKRTAAQITKFNYHLENTIPEHFSEELMQMISSTLPKIKSKKGIRGMNFHFVDHLTEGVQFVDAQSILMSAKKNYLGADCVKVSQNMYKNTKSVKTSILPIQGVFSELIQFCILDKNSQKNSLASSRIPSVKFTKNDLMESELPAPKHYPKKKNDNFQLYVIHHCYTENGEKADTMNWENFIQRYHFRREFHEDQVKPVIHYNLIFNYQQDQGFFSYFTSRSSLYQQYLDEHLKCKGGQLQNIRLLQGYLLQSREKVSKKLEIMNDPAFDQSHKKWLKLSPQHYKMFLTLKNHAANQHKALYGQKQHLSQLALSSLVYRYMYAKEYDFKECYEHIIEYLKWQKHLFQNFNLLMFQKFHSLDFFTYLGNDFEGRAVVLNKASNLIIENIDSVEDYCNYYCYFLEVFVPRKLRGYADQFLIIADLTNLSSDNFKLSITKQNLNDSLKFCPERQFKFIAFNLAGFATALWKLFKNLLPKRSLSKINIIGQDKNEILDVLLAQMDISVIPEYLGGNNKRSFRNDLEDEAEVLINRQ